MRLGHITDTHIDGSFDRSLRLANAIGRAFDLQVDHIVFTGDLTATGSEQEARELSRVLARWPKSGTVVGGNHDGPNFNEHAERWLHTRFARSGATVVGGVAIVPIDTFYPRRAWGFRALGRVGGRQMAVLQDTAVAARGPVVIAMHHGPQGDPLKAFAGLTDRHRIQGLLRAHPHVSVCCGHDHRVLDVGQVHVAASCASHADPLRVYDVGVGFFRSIHRSGDQGSYFAGLPPC